MRLAATFLLALAVRLAWVPTWSRLTFDGHDRLYLRAFLGDPPDASGMANPLLLALYGLLGRLSHDPRLLLVFSALTGALAVVGVALWAERRFGPWAGVWAGLLVALLGEHAAWSTSPYPVILPHALLVWAFVWRGWGSALLLALAAALRPELALVGLFRGWPGLAGLLGAGAWALLDTVHPSDPWVAFQLNWRMVRFLGPPVLVLAALGWSRRTAPLFGVVALVHLSGAPFDDYGARHALLGGALLCVLAGVAAARWGGIVALVVAVGLAVDTADIARAWYAREPLDAGGLGPPPEGCVEVTEEPPIPGQALPSHFHLPEADCVVWGEEFWHRQWSSRGLRDRALKLRTLYDLELVGARTDGPTVRLYWRLR